MPASRRIIADTNGLQRRIPTFRQYADEKLDYEFLFADRLETGEVIASVEVTQSPEDSLTLSDQSNTTSSATLFVSDGREDRATIVTVKATTDAAVPRKYTLSMRLEILSR